MKIRLEAGFIVHDGKGNPQSADELSRHLDDVMDALLALEGVIDPDISASLAAGHVEIAVTVEAPSDLEAVEKGFAAMRTGIHTAGGFTGSWAIERQIQVQHYEQLTLT